MTDGGPGVYLDTNLFVGVFEVHIAAALSLEGIAVLAVNPFTLDDILGSKPS